jgi:hypothetical protein
MIFSTASTSSAQLHLAAAPCVQIADLKRGRLPPDRIVAATLLFHALAACAVRLLS